MGKMNERLSSLTIFLECFLLQVIKSIKKDPHGSLTMTLAIAMVMFALPSQIIKNYNSGDCGLSFLMTALPLSVYLSRAFYAKKIKVWYIWVPDALGVIFSLVLLGQYILYKFLL